MTTSPEALPERVRARVTAYAADALGALPADHVPAPLKRAAAFTPQRRARIAGQQILDLLATDDEFRERIGVQAKARQRDVAAALADGSSTPETAALGYLLGAPGWEDAVERLRLEEPEGASGGGEELASLRRSLDAAVAEQVATRQAAKAEVATVRAEIAELRRKLGEARKQAREARSEAERVTSEAAARIAGLDAAAASTEAELRRLRTQVASLEADVSKAQRAARADRGEGTLRARLLLDTLLQAGQGLRKELALPVVHGSPADRVEAELAESGTRDSSGTGSLALDDPALVREVLGLPRMHLVIDGYNVTRAEWDDMTLEAQRTRLLRGLGPLAARTGAEITVVFDGTNAESRPAVHAPRGVRVLFSPRGVLADDVVRDLVEAEPAGRPIAVVTSDQEIVRDVLRRAGVRVVGSRALVRLLS